MLGSRVRAPEGAQTKFCNFMYSLKEYPNEFKRSKGKQWARFKRVMKKIAHTQLRRGKMEKYHFEGKEIAW